MRASFRLGTETGELEKMDIPLWLLPRARNGIARAIP